MDKDNRIKKNINTTFGFSGYFKEHDNSKVVNCS